MVHHLVWETKLKKKLKLIKLGSRDNRSNEQEPDLPGGDDCLSLMDTECPLYGYNSQGSHNQKKWPRTWRTL